VSRVLIVEDEVHLAQGLRFNLEAEGLEVEVVGDGETALNLLLGRKQQFDASCCQARMVFPSQQNCAPPKTMYQY